MKEIIIKHKQVLKALVIAMIMLTVFSIGSKTKEDRKKEFIKANDIAKQQILDSTKPLLDNAIISKENLEKSLTETKNNIFQLTECIEYNSNTGTLDIERECNTFTGSLDTPKETVEINQPKEITEADIKTYEEKEENLLKPNELFYGVKKRSDCHVTASEDKHRDFLGRHMNAVDYSCSNQQMDLYVPDYRDKAVSYMGYCKKSKYLGRYIELVSIDKGINIKWIMGHVEGCNLKDGQVVRTGKKVGKMSLEGAFVCSSGKKDCYHGHTEFYSCEKMNADGNCEIWGDSKRYTVRWKKIEELRSKQLDPIGHVNHKHNSEKQVNKKQDNITYIQKQLAINTILKAYGREDDIINSRWLRVAEKYKIKQEVLVCIAQIETHIGRHLKSPHNYGNVGNNDRGDTQGFSNAIQGIDKIGWTLRHGTYLGGNLTIGDLSTDGGGNKRKYASDPNHINNLKACLSKLEGVKVSENYTLRY